jgi:hypothetical protein
MGETGKEVRRRQRERVAAYHEAGVADLLSHVAAAIDSYREGELTVEDTDAALYQYHRATKELWKFCFGTSVAFVVETIDRAAQPVDWWQRGEPRHRR